MFKNNLKRIVIEIIDEWQEIIKLGPKIPLGK